MTLVLGARCKDGVVIASDRKFTKGGIEKDGSFFDFNDNFENHKVAGEIFHVVYHFTGHKAGFEAFRTRVKELVPSWKDSVKTETDLLDRLSKIVEEESEHENFDLLVGLHFTKPELYRITSDGKYDRADCCSMGVARQTADRLLREIPISQMSITQFAKTSYFIIKYLETFVPDCRVGTGDKHPVISYLRNDQPIDDQPSEEEYLRIRQSVDAKINEIGLHISGLKDFFLSAV